MFRIVAFLVVLSVSAHSEPLKVYDPPPGRLLCGRSFSSLKPCDGAGLDVGVRNFPEIFCETSSNRTCFHSGTLFSAEKFLPPDGPEYAGVDQYYELHAFDPVTGRDLLNSGIGSCMRGPIVMYKSDGSVLFEIVKGMEIPEGCSAK